MTNAERSILERMWEKFDDFRGEMSQGFIRLEEKIDENHGDTDGRLKSIETWVAARTAQDELLQRQGLTTRWRVGILVSIGGVAVSVVLAIAGLS